MNGKRSVHALLCACVPSFIGCIQVCRIHHMTMDMVVPSFLACPTFIKAEYLLWVLWNNEYICPYTFGHLDMPGIQSSRFS